MSEWTKDPDETLDFAIDWSDVLTADSDTIASAVWTLPAGFTKVSQAEASSRTTIWISGGNLSARPYRVLCRMTTVGGRIYDRSASISVISK